MVDNGPTFQRWVRELRVLEVPKGRLKLRDSSAVPSGLHSILSLFPKVETLGYYRASLREKDLAPLLVDCPMRFAMLTKVQYSTLQRSNAPTNMEACRDTS